MNPEINKQLDEKIPMSVISTRQGGGNTTLDYLEGHYVIDRMNKIFGNTGWDKIVEVLDKEKEVTKKSKGTDCFTYTVVVKCRVQTKFGAFTEKTVEDIGSCSGTSYKSFGEALEMAYKGAVTDAFKRCAKDLGQSMGLALYDKEQPNVVDDSRPVEIKFEDLATKDHFLLYIGAYVARAKEPGDIIRSKIKEEFKFTSKVADLPLNELKKIALYLAMVWPLKQPIYKNEIIK